MIETCSPVGLELQFLWLVVRALHACVTDPSKHTHSWAAQGDTWHVLSLIIVGGLKCVLRDSTGTRLLEACSLFSLDFFPCAFSFG